MSKDKLWYKYWPEGVPKTIEIPVDISVDDMLRSVANEHPTLPAVAFHGRNWTYGWLNDQVNRLAKGLQDLGLQKGDRVCVNMPNIPQYVIAFFGVMRAGGVISPIVPLQKAAEIQHQINDSGAKMLIIMDQFYEEEVQKLVEANKIPNVEKIILTGVGEYLKTIVRILGNLLGKVPRMKKWPVGPKFVKFQDVLNSDPNPKEVKFDTKKDLAVLMYTGGTTGLPKGAMLSQYNIVANCYQCASWMPGVKPGEEATVCALPLSHIFGLTTMMSVAVKVGGKMILIANAKDIPAVMSDLTKEKGTLFAGVNALFNKINNHPNVKKFNLSSVKYALSGAGPLAEEVQNKFESLTGAKIVEGFGLTEASPVTHANPLQGRRKIGSVGFPFPNTDCKIINPDTLEEIPQPGKDDDITTHGEICIKGPQVMLGYYKREEATKSTIVDGWLRTGDIGYIDDEGYLHIKDRLKDMIKYKGHSVYPREVEDLLYLYEPINEVGVIGVKDKSGEENIKAVVSLKPEYIGKITVEDIKKWAQENIAGYKWPRIVEIKEEIPTTNVGKVLRRKLREE
ncbi:MAG TPA: long-chain fatty acid--CoA ligase [Candidatus Deferrimicrobium sp.]|nr:long-chain fatty acid--CoA ligase [Candidatus Deferrimicrobium sp.]